MRPRTHALVSLATGAALALCAPAARAQLLPHAPQVDRLPNGLTVVTVPFDSPGIAAYYTLVRTGSRDEVEPGHSGFAHLFEHMMFRGTRQMDARAYEHRMQALGADNNAYTTEDFTLYTVTVPSAQLPALVPIEADRFEHLYYSEPTFQTETRAVLGEYNKNAANPLQQMWESLSELAFTRHTYGHTTMGYLRDIEAMPHEYAYSQRFFQRFYRPDNTTVIVAGDVQRDAVLALVRQNYAGWTGRRATPTVPREPEQTAPRARALAWEGTTPPRMLAGYRVPGFELADTDAVALQVVHALAFSESSELYQRLVVREQKLLTLESWRSSFMRDPGLFLIEARLAPGASFDEIERAITDELARIGRGEYPRARIEEVVSNLRYSMPMELQTPAAVANELARFMALTGDVGTMEQYHQRLSSVTPEDVARVARTYLVPARRDTITLTQADHAPADAVHVGPNHGTQVAPAGPASPPGPATHPRPSPGATPTTARPRRPR